MLKLFRNTTIAYFLFFFWRNNFLAIVKKKKKNSKKNISKFPALVQLDFFFGHIFCPGFKFLSVNFY